MHIFPTDEEVEQATDLMVNTYGVSAHLLGKLFGTEQRDQANSILQDLGGGRLSKFDVARLLIKREGPNLLAGSKDITRKLRSQILSKLPDEKIEQLYEQNPTPGKKISAANRKRKELAKKKWSSGKKWARDFVTSTEFPAIFAGVEQGEKVPSFYDVQPLKFPPTLAEFQEGLKRQMLEVLERDGDRTRCVVTLPTGGGKTRVAVEAFIDWMQPRFAEGKYLIWIAQSEELCEQAIACIEQMWSSRQFIRPLRVYRFFGGREISTDYLSGGAVVASIQQLYSRANKDNIDIEMILKDTGAMIIDEAHRAVSHMYDTLLDRAEKVCGQDLFPICGLTATPGRAGLNSSKETDKLVGRFEVYLVKPELEGMNSQNPLRYFREHQFLAKARHILYHSGCEYELTDDDLDGIKREHDLPAGFLKRLAADEKRNLHIIRRLLQLPKSTPTLVYACTVEHAYFLAAILNARGRKATAVSSDTPMTLRRAIIHDFKEGKIDVICNYGVLTTGFDAPKTECVALCRPTTSEVLYEQIIGRGLRGPRFGGTEECTIIDFADNIRRLGPPLAYKRFEDFWSAEETEGG